MREGTVFKRCGPCGTRVPDRRCSKCGSDSWTWAYLVDVAPPGAPRKQRKRAGFRTKGAALEALQALQAELAAGTAVAPSKITTGEYLARWVDGVKVRATTERSYRQAVRKLTPLIGGIPLQELDRGAVMSAYQKLAETPKRGGGLPATKTIHNVHLALVVALNAALDQRPPLARVNAAHRAHQPPRDDEKPEMQVWTKAQLRAFLEASEDDQLAPLYRLAAMTGARRGEILGARWQDLDLEEGTYRVAQQLTRAKVEGAYIWGFRAPKTRAGRRTVDLDPQTVAVLKAHHARQTKTRLLMGSAYELEADLVFARADGSHLDPDWVSTAHWDALVARAPVRRIRFHDLRHTHASHLLTAGVPVNVVAYRLGHKSAAVTLAIYAHFLPDSARGPVHELAAAIDGGRA